MTVEDEKEENGRSGYTTQSHLTETSLGPSRRVISKALEWNE